MKNQVKLTLKEYKHEHDYPYEVVGIENSVKWFIGERLSKREVQSIIDNKVKPVKVVIK